MPQSKFGGIPVEDQPQQQGGSKFGGVPVDQPKPKPEEKPDIGTRVLRTVLGPLANSMTSLGRGMHSLVHPGEQPWQDTASDIAEGGAGVALPFAAPSMLARPLSTLIGGGIGALAQKAGSKVTEMAGGSPSTQRFVGNVTGAAAGPSLTEAASSVPGGIARSLGRRALGITGKIERNGADPIRALFEDTTSVRPQGIADQAAQNIKTQGQRLTQVANRPLPESQWPSLEPAITSGRRSIANAAAGNDLFAPHEWQPMVRELTEPQPGFAGRTAYPPGAHTPISFTPTASPLVGPGGQPIAGPPTLNRGPAPQPMITPQQNPADFLGMKRRFTENFTKFDANNPRSSGATQVGNEMNHELSSEFNRRVPGAAEINQRLQDNIPLRNRAEIVAEQAGPFDKAIDQFTRPTGGLVAPLLAFGKGGATGAGAMITAQQMMASPTAKLAMARPLFDLSRGMKSPAASRGARLLPMIPWGDRQ